MSTVARKRVERQRILGPYPHHRGWRLILVAPDGSREACFFATREEAEHEKALLEANLDTIVHTTETGLEAFVKDLQTRQLSPRTVEGYTWAIKTWWPDVRPLHALNKVNCTARYKELQGRLSVDSHRNALKMAKTFLRWCVSQHWIRENPLEGVQGVGRRKKGKPQLRIDEARVFYRHCLAKAGAGDPGAVAALMALLLTMRSECEILATTVRDIDDGGRLLVIEHSKSEAGIRSTVIPEELRPALLELARGKPPDGRLFHRRDRKWLWEEVARLCTEAGVPRVPPHGLRGGGATAAKQENVASLAIAAALGHASVKVTEEHYIDKTAAAAADQERKLQLVRGGKR